MKTEILRILRTSKEAVSGQLLCEQLGRSRTAVWKVMNQLKEEGYEIEAVQNRGYKILKYPDIMTREELESRLADAVIGHEVYYYEETGSTNVMARQLAEAGAPDGTLVVAEVQNAGKGRRGRGWNSAAGTGIFMTLILRPEIHPNAAAMMTLVMAMAVVKGIRETAGVQARIKWPNDVLLDQKKVCGILTEMSMESDYINYVVTGCGINVNMDSFPDELVDKAVSVRQVCGQKVNRAEMTVAVLKAFEAYYAEFIRTGDLSGLKAEYEEHLINVGKEVAVQEGDKIFTGTALGINDKGELLVRGADGMVKQVYAGEVSVRGIYGYV